jgi:hypothetical protein
METGGGQDVDRGIDAGNAAEISDLALRIYPSDDSAPCLGTEKVQVISFGPP